MKICTLLLLSLLFTQIFAELSCGEIGFINGEPGPCSDEACCFCRQNPNPSTGNGFLEFDDSCKFQGGGLHCIDSTGCRLCHKPTFGAMNVGDRPVCVRFEGLNSQCDNDECCMNQQNSNPQDGNGFLEFNEECKINGGGLHCVADSGCRLCYKRVLGATNVGNRPVCARFEDMEAEPSTLIPNCDNETCCIDNQNPNHADGNGFLEFNSDCKANGGGLHCVHDSGCRLCYKPILGSNNVGDRPICARFVNLLPKCNDSQCCLDLQNPNNNDGNGFLEFDMDCKLNGGGLHCVHDTGCRLCYKPILGSSNIGDRPTCTRFRLQGM